MFRARRFRSRCGRCCAKFHPVGHARTARLRRGLAIRARRVRSLAPARATASLSSFHVIASYAPMARWVVTSGARSASRHCSRGESACDEGGFNNTRFNVKFTIAMPRGLRLRASTGNGDLSVEKAGSEVELRTGNGGIHIGQTEGRVTAATGNGDLEVESAHGPVR